MKHIKSISALLTLPCIFSVPSHFAVAHSGNRRLRGTVLPSITNANDEHLLDREASVASPGWVWAMKGRMELSRELEGMEEGGTKVEKSSATVAATVELLDMNKYIYPPNDQAYTGISGPLPDGRIATTGNVGDMTVSVMELMLRRVEDVASETYFRCLLLPCFSRCTPQSGGRVTSAPSKRDPSLQC